MVIDWKVVFFNFKDICFYFEFRYTPTYSSLLWKEILFRYNFLFLKISILIIYNTQGCIFFNETLFPLLFDGVGKVLGFRFCKNTIFSGLSKCQEQRESVFFLSYRSYVHFSDFSLNRTCHLTPLYILEKIYFPSTAFLFWLRDIKNEK